jgi:ferredoxin
MFAAPVSGVRVYGVDPPKFEETTLLLHALEHILGHGKFQLRGAGSRALPRRFKTLYDTQLSLLGEPMTHVVTEACIRCKYSDCVDVCPVDCFREGPNMLVIDPDECIDCAVCIPECPVNAIYADVDLPGDQEKFVALNAELAKIFPSITDKKEPPPDADQWKEVKDKLEYLER